MLSSSTEERSAHFSVCFQWIGAWIGARDVLEWPHFDHLPISALGGIQSHGSAKQSYESLLVRLLAFAEIDGAPNSGLEAGIEGTRGVIQKGALSKTT